MRTSIVPVGPEHHGFIMSNWLKQYRYDSHSPVPPSDIYYALHKELIKQNIGGYVAVNAEDPDQYIGFACGDASVVHFIFVKEVFHGLGIGKSLYAALGSPKQYSHHTKQVRNNLGNMQFNPYGFYKGSSHV